MPSFASGQFLGRDETLPSVMASDPAHDPNALPVEALKKPHHDALSTYNPAFRGIQKQREHGRLVRNLLLQTPSQAQRASSRK